MSDQEIGEMRKRMLIELEIEVALERIAKKHEVSLNEILDIAEGLRD